MDLSVSPPKILTKKKSKNLSHECSRERMVLKLLEEENEDLADGSSYPSLIVGLESHLLRGCRNPSVEYMVNLPVGVARVGEGQPSICH